MIFKSSLLLLITAEIYVILASGLAQDTRDPLEDFCRRFGHATAEVDRKLFINGGQFDSNPISELKYNRTSELKYSRVERTRKGC